MDTDRESGKTRQQIIAEYEMEKRESIKRIRENPYEPGEKYEYWTDKQREELTDQYFMGIDISQIALNFSRSESAILAQIQILGLRVRTRISKPKNPELKCIYPECKCPECKHVDEC